ncbi:MAG: DUF4058 family protein [Chloroflexaceae bacterium]|nr:DUF4058 family protein [Chloroflexaceae bacterium]NJO06288.1 DUF4058 family protein [Chloroflexaceae bacterium]
MPSPFPGMDPYLEGDLWQEFHDTLANTIRAQLLPQIAPKYVALLSKRYVLSRADLGIVDITGERVFYPDAHVVTNPTASQHIMLGQSVADITTPTIELASPMLEEVPLLSVEIRDVAQRQLVTLIEILSPVNKTAEGARDYAQRRAELLQTRTHLLELDLLRQGNRIQLLGTPPPASYYLYLSRVQRRPYTQVWAVALRQTLPIVPVPLLPSDADATLHVQAAVDACFELVGYERLIDYRATLPPPALSDADAAWVVELIHEQ